MVDATVRLGDIVRIRTGKLDANANVPNGEFPFFTCAVEPLRISTYSYDCECVLVAGNGDLNVKYYDGKFDAYQRTYIIESINSHVLHVRYLARFMDRYVEQLRHLSIGGVIKYIKMEHLTEPRIPLPPLPEQRRIAAILDQADALRAKRRVALAQLDSLTQSIFIEMFGDPEINGRGLPVSLLGDLCNRVTDGTHQSPEWVADGIPFLFISNIVNGRIAFDTTKFISSDTHLQLTRRCPIEVGDVLYTTVGSYGNTAVVDTKKKFAFQRHIAHLKPDQTRLNSGFLAAMLEAPGVRRQVDRVAKGVAQKTVNLADLKSLRVFAPALASQQQFAYRLDMVNSLKAACQVAIDELDALFASLQHRAFRGEL